MNVALLDAATGRTISRSSPSPLLEPELAWEREGDVDNVVFVQGAHRRDDGTIYLTYGAADRVRGRRGGLRGSAAVGAPRRSLTDVRPSLPTIDACCIVEMNGDRRLGALVAD